MSIVSCPGDVANKLRKALGLPNNIRSFELRVANDEIVTCKVEMFLDNINAEDFKAALVEYELCKKVVHD